MKTAGIADHQAPGQTPQKRQPDASLDRRYGRIGISALVAALPYRSESKNAAYAPAEARD